LRSLPVQFEARVLANPPPTAVASAPATVSPRDPVVLDGSRSTDPDGQIVQWTWTLVATAGGSGGSLQVNQPMEIDQPEFDLGVTGTTLAVGVHRFQLEVTDDSGLRSLPVQFEVRVLGSCRTAGVSPRCPPPR
ncbi:MAG TPA: PKD domain-containing protein, partial [Gemmatimonadota bacterium]|nr:PKD domain-containing protein [Gemmatimonadota bacterium]